MAIFQFTDWPVTSDQWQWPLNILFSRSEREGRSQLLPSAQVWCPQSGIAGLYSCCCGRWLLRFLLLLLPIWVSHLYLQVFTEVVVSTAKVKEEAEDEEDPRLVHLSLSGVDMWTEPELFQGGCCVHWPGDGAGGKAFLSVHILHYCPKPLSKRVFWKPTFLGGGG